jgi:hypothetical protein
VKLLEIRDTNRFKYYNFTIHSFVPNYLFHNQFVIWKIKTTADQILFRNIIKKYWKRKRMGKLIPELNREYNDINWCKKEQANMIKLNQIIEIRKGNKKAQLTIKFLYKFLSQKIMKKASRK